MDNAGKRRGEKPLPFWRGHGRPLWQSPIIGGLYIVIGIAFGLIGWIVGGWVAVPLWVLAVLSGLAGVWTPPFTGLFLIMGHLLD
jgi:hypothetical protein